MSKSNYTIKDIAKLANVSRGMVDKVIHGREGVSDENRERIKAIIKKVKYKPNVLGQSLRNHRTFNIAVLMPEFEGEGYWFKCFSGIQEAANSFSSFGIKWVCHYYKRTANSYTQVFNKMIQSGPDAVLIIPLEFHGSLELYRNLESLKLPYMFLNSKIPGAQYSGFIGQNYKSSGRVAANMMAMLVGDNDSIAVLHEFDGNDLSNHLQQKEEGFRSYFMEKGYSNKIQSVKIDSSNFPAVENPISDKEIKGIYITTSNAVQLIEKWNLNADVKIVGYDLTPMNVTYLKEGRVDILLHQKPWLQGYNGFKTLTESLLFKRQITKDHYLSIDIITPENLEIQSNSNPLNN